MKKAVIFDFDGTIVDNFQLAVEIFYEVTDRQNPLTSGEINRLRSLSLVQVAVELGVPFWKGPYLLFRGRRILGKRITQAKLVAGMPELIKKLHRRYDLYIVSSNSQANIEKVLSKHDLSKYFKGIYGKSRWRSKRRILRRICRRRGYTSAKTCYVGDETRDIDAAHHAGLKSIAVAWGYNNIRALNRHHPEKIVFEPSEIHEYLVTIK